MADNVIEFNLGELLIYNYINVSSLVKKSKIENNRFDTFLNRKTLEDYDFWLGLALAGLKFKKAQGQFLDYRVQNQSRNDNTSSVEVRILNFIAIWKYSIEKYQKVYPSKISKDVVFDELKYQMSEVSGELNRLNIVIHEELIPELESRAQHIEHQDNIIKQLQLVNKDLSDKLSKTINSRLRKIAHYVNKPVSRIIKRTKKL